MSTAIDIFLNQVSLTGGIPFPVALPKAPESVNTDQMTGQEIRSMLAAGVADIESGNVYNATAAFAAFRKTQNEKI
jgi:antitoxin component of RelBE/YafQ-DinJ toxin-antitoxin module